MQVCSVAFLSLIAFTGNAIKSVIAYKVST